MSDADDGYGVFSNDYGNEDIASNISRFLGHDDLLRLTSTNRMLRNFGHIDGRTVRQDRQVRIIHDNFKRNTKAHDRTSDGTGNPLTDIAAVSNFNTIMKRADSNKQRDKMKILLSCRPKFSKKSIKDLFRSFFV